MLFGLIWYAPRADHLGTAERFFLFFGVGVITGTIGINYSHELMHQKNKLERFLGDALLAMVLVFTLQVGAFAGPSPLCREPRAIRSPRITTRGFTAFIHVS